ncbi:hypothetical protein QFZ63_000458 [Streptomyces sp. B3I7]|nr:hypothetical protein [Streptomyces sp. B3I7]
MDREFPSDQFSHLRVPPDGLCWWCRVRPATTGEHKFKRSSLARLMGESQMLIWGNGESKRELRGKTGITRDRYGVVKFPKSMCGECNNEKSKPLDGAYDIYEEYVRSHLLRVTAALDLGEIYGNEWREQARNLARYHAKHFGCRMVRGGVPVPQSLRDFLDGAEDMPDAHMAIISTDTIHRTYGKGFSISPDLVHTDAHSTRFVRYVMAAYAGSIGVRYEWREGGISDAERSQFFHYICPVINMFRDDMDMALGNTRKPGWLARILHWANKPPQT